MVIRHRYGIDECEVQTLEELADALELTREQGAPDPGSRPSASCAASSSAGASPRTCAVSPCGPWPAPPLPTDSPIIGRKPFACSSRNARCSKSRSACQLLEERGLAFEVVEYLKTPPSRDRARRRARQAGHEGRGHRPQGRRGPKLEFKGRSLTEAEWLDALVAHPILIERPIVVCGERAVIEAPAEGAGACCRRSARKSTPGRARPRPAEVHLARAWLSLPLAAAARAALTASPSWNTDMA